MRKILGFGLILASCWVSAQQSITTDYCLKKLSELQSAEDGFYPKGIFPTQRYWISDNGEEDNNVFTTASIAYILRSSNQRKPDARIDKLLEKAITSFENYRSRNDEAAYNHWQTIGDDLPFPNSKLLARERFRLPDDYDDTAVIQLARGRHPMDDAIRKKMLDYALRPNREDVVHFPSAHSSKKVYEVWYADKMKQELDVVVMSNVLLFVMDRGYSLETPDLHTIQCLKTCIDEAWYFSNPEGFSPYYNRTPVILYHLARMIDADKSNAFEKQRKLLIDHLRKALSQSDQAIEGLMLATSLRRLGEPVKISLSKSRLKKDVQSFSFFSYESPILAMRMLPAFYWRSEAVSWAMVYEFLSFDPAIEWTE